MAKAKAKEVKETPLMKQYNAIKAKHPGALLLFRVGDFYETFGEDAIRASKILDIVLTKRANGAASHIELAGFPHHSLDSYLPRLVRAGNRVAICDQLEDPREVKGIVKRGVTELVTLNLKGFGIENLEHGIIASGAILYYLEETEHKEVKHIASISRIAEEKYVWLDKFTIRNLELLFPQQEGGVP